MAYSIYIYARPNSNIAYTKIEFLATGEVKTVYKKEAENFDENTWTEEDWAKHNWFMETFTDVTGNVKFTAYPDSGYTFSEFLIQFGNDGIQRSTDENPYTYTGTKDIHIRAVAIPAGSTSRIEEFDWHSSNGSASAEQTERAWGAVVNHGKIKDFSHLVWNDMVDKVCEVLDANDEVWDSRGGLLTPENTKMTSEDREMTALRFNSFGLNAMNACGVNRWTNVQRGDQIIGSVFIDTMESLNDYIRTWLQ